MDNNVLDAEMYHHGLNLIKASKGKRFTNYLIDTTIAIMLSVTLEFGLSEIGFSFLYDMILMDRLIYALLFALYFIITESLLKGKSIGKIITRTRAVTEDGMPMDMSTIIKRSFSRIVPFDAFSFLGENSNGWHDTWSKTTVIDENKTPQTIL